MKNFVVKTLANAGALAVAVWLLDKITLTGDSTGKEIGTLLLVALVFGLVNFLVKPIVKVLTFPLFVLTLGLITLVVNALMLLLTSWVAGLLNVGWHVDSFWTAVGGAIVVSIVSFIANAILGTKKHESA